MLHSSNSETALVPANPLVSRFTIAILASLLCGVGFGRSLTADIASLCGLTGLAGFAGCLGLDLAAQMRRQDRSETLRTSAEYRLLAHSAPAWLPTAAHFTRLQDEPTVAAIAYDGGGWERWPG